MEISPATLGVAMFGPTLFVFACILLKIDEWKERKANNKPRAHK